MSSPLTDSYFRSGPHQLFRRTCAPERPRASVLILHGYGEHCGRYAEFMRWLADRRVASYAFDFRGHGRSAGKRAFVSTWEEFLDDACAFAATVPADVPRFVLGHSHGGLVATALAAEGRVAVNGYLLSSPYLRAAFRVPRAKLVVANVANVVMPSVCIPNGLTGDMMTRDPAMREESHNDPLLLRYATPRWFKESTAAQDRLRDRGRDVRSPLLMLVGTVDVIAKPEANLTFFNACASTDKQLIQYDGAHHELLRDVNRQQVFIDIARWVESRTAAS